MKGCYIFCTDEETNEYFKEMMGSPKSIQPVEIDAIGVVETEAHGELEESNVITLPLVESARVKPFINSVPIYDLDIAAGLFSDFQMVDEASQNEIFGDADSFNWVELPEFIRPSEGMFVARVVGESMNRRIPNGSWCLFKLNPAGTRQGKVVLVQHHCIEDPDTGGRYTIKVYQSEKVSADDGGWRHSKVILKPDSSDFNYKPIVFDSDNVEELVVIAELVAVMPW